MERRPFVRGKSKAQEPSEPATPSGPRPVLLRKHSTTLPVAKVHLIEPGRILLIPAVADRERDAVASAWQAASGAPAERVDRFWQPDSSLRGKCACVYGNVIFCQEVANVLGLTLVSPAENLLTSLPRELLGRSVFVYRLDEIEDLTYPCFVKALVPKLITAGVVPSSERLSEITLGLEADTLLLVSEPVKFRAEARAFICNRKVLDLAIYSGRSSLEAAREVAEAVALLETTPHGFVVDLGKIEDSWVVVKFNPVWASALNGCDAQKVLPAIAAGTRA